MSVLLYDIFNIMQNFVITLNLGQGEYFLLSVSNFLLNFQLGLGAAPLRECLWRCCMQVFSLLSI